MRVEWRMDEGAARPHVAVQAPQSGSAFAAVLDRLGALALATVDADRAGETDTLLPAGAGQVTGPEQDRDGGQPDPGVPDCPDHEGEDREAATDSTRVDMPEVADPIPGQHPKGPSSAPVPATFVPEPAGSPSRQAGPQDPPFGAEHVAPLAGPAEAPGVYGGHATILGGSAPDADTVPKTAPDETEAWAPAVLGMTIRHPEAAEDVPTAPGPVVPSAIFADRTSQTDPADLAPVLPVTAGAPGSRLLNPSAGPEVDLRRDEAAMSGAPAPGGGFWPTLAAFGAPHPSPASVSAPRFPGLAWVRDVPSQIALDHTAGAAMRAFRPHHGEESTRPADHATPGPAIPASAPPTHVGATRVVPSVAPKTAPLEQFFHRPASRDPLSPHSGDLPGPGVRAGSPPFSASGMTPSLVPAATAGMAERIAHTAPDSGPLPFGTGVAPSPVGDSVPPTVGRTIGESSRAAVGGESLGAPEPGDDLRDAVRAASDGAQLAAARGPGAPPAFGFATVGPSRQAVAREAPRAAEPGRNLQGGARSLRDAPLVAPGRVAPSAARGPDSPPAAGLVTGGTSGPATGHETLRAAEAGPRFPGQEWGPQDRPRAAPERVSPHPPAGPMTDRRGHAAPTEVVRDAPPMAAPAGGAKGAARATQPGDMPRLPPAPMPADTSAGEGAAPPAKVRMPAMQQGSAAEPAWQMTPLVGFAARIGARQSLGPVPVSFHGSGPGVPELAANVDIRMGQAPIQHEARQADRPHAPAPGQGAGGQFTHLGRLPPTGPAPLPAIDATGQAIAPGHGVAVAPLPPQEVAVPSPAAPSPASPPAAPGEPAGPATVPAAGPLVAAGDLPGPVVPGPPTTAASTPAGTSHAVPAPFPAPVEQVAAQVRALADGAVEVALSPAELGTVRLSIRHEAEQTVVHVIADRPETLDLMRRHADQLASALRDAGFTDVHCAFSQGRGQPPLPQPAQPDRATAEPRLAPAPVRSSVPADDRLDIRL